MKAAGAGLFVFAVLGASLALSRRALTMRKPAPKIIAYDTPSSPVSGGKVSQSPAVDPIAANIVQAYRISPELAAKIVEVAHRVGIRQPYWLANVINFESRFDPAIRNPRSGATGLIQFMPGPGRAAEEVGTTTDALARMTAVQQMEYVARYFELPRIKGRGALNSQIDVYMAVFYPVAVGQGASYRFPANVQAANPGIATAGDYAAMANVRARLPVT